MIVMKTSISLLLFSLCIFCITLSAQPRNEWRLFADMEFEEFFNEDIGTYDLKPVISDDILALEGQEVVLLGYIISSSKTDGFENVILSKFPFTSCYFCGNAGMETVAEIEYC